LTVTPTSLYRVVTKHKLGLPFPRRNLRIKFGANPSTICLVIVFTDRQTYIHTHTQTPVKTLPRFRGDNYSTEFTDNTEKYYAQKTILRILETEGKVSLLIFRTNCCYSETD